VKHCLKAECACPAREVFAVWCVVTDPGSLVSNPVIRSLSPALAACLTSTPLHLHPTYNLHATLYSIHDSQILSRI
jgi:hypothetical protein